MFYKSLLSKCVFLSLVAGSLYADSLPKKTDYLPKNPPSKAEEVSDAAFFASASYLYWKATEDGLEVGTNYAVDPTGFRAYPTGAFNYNPEYRSAFKVDLGYRFPDWNWEIVADYTWFHHNFNAVQKANFVDYKELNPLASIWAAYKRNLFTKETGIAASFQWHLGLDYVDLLARYTTHAAGIMTWKPSFGLRAVLLQQETKARGNIRFAPIAPSTQITSAKSWGIGPALGIDGSLALGSGFSIVGHGLVGLLAMNNYSLNFYSSPQEIGASPIHLNQNWHTTMRANAEGNLGLEWKYVTNNKAEFMVAALWDMVAFFNANMINAYTSALTVNSAPSTPGNLYLQGLTVRVGVVF